MRKMLFYLCICIIFSCETPQYSLIETERGRIIQEIEENMVFVEGGTFMMGCVSPTDTLCESDEFPTHAVTLSSYYIGKYEVTNEQWIAIMGIGSGVCLDCPVESLSHDDASAFLVTLNKYTKKRYSLPTEAQWEYASRGGNKSKGYIYSGSNNIDDVGWYDKNSGNQGHPVGTKAPNELGIYDMTANVGEWCADWYELYGNSPVTDPKGALLGTDRTIRGGSWNRTPTVARSSKRGKSPPVNRNGRNGFRIVTTAP